MRKTTISALAVVFALLATSGFAAASWDHYYTDSSYDVVMLDVDITSIRSYTEASDIILEMIVSGDIENSSQITYYIRIGSSTSQAGLMYHDGTGIITYVGGGSTSSGVSFPARDTIRARFSQTHAGNPADFDIWGEAKYDMPSPASDIIDYAGPTDQGSQTPVDGIFGMAVAMFLLLVLLPIIIIIVIVIVLVVVLAKKKPPTQVPPQQQMQQPYQQYPPQYQQPPQQPPQQYPPQQPPQQPGQ